MSLESAQAFVARLREDAQFRWALGECRDQWERRRFVVLQGYRFSPAELVCATSPAGRASPEPRCWVTLIFTMPSGTVNEV